MEILVTGASGFLGQRLCKRLKEDGHNVFEVSSKVCDLTSEESIYYNLPDRKFDQIYHLAAWTRAGDFCLTHQGEQFLINQRLNTNVLGWWKDQQPQAKLIAMGTSCAYSPELPLIEENYLKDIPIDSLFSYAYTKRALYAGMIALNKQFGLKYMLFVPSTLYGPTYHTDRNDHLHFIFDLARKIVRGKKYGEKVTLWGDGYQSRELVHVNDAINAMVALSSHENDIINLGEGNEHTIREFAQIISDHVEYDSSLIEYDTSKYVGAKSKVLNVDKMKRMLPGFKPTPIKEGIVEMVDWMANRE